MKALTAFIGGLVIIFAGCGGDGLVRESPSEQNTPKIPIISLKEIRVQEWWYPTKGPPGYNSQKITPYFSLEAAEPLPYAIAVDLVVSGKRIQETTTRRWLEDEGRTIIEKPKRGDEVDFKEIITTMWWVGDPQVKEFRNWYPDYPVKTYTIQILTWDKNRTFEKKGILHQVANWWIARESPYEVGSPSLLTWKSPTNNFEEVFK